MLASVEYHDSTYAFAYGVLPSYRRMVRFSPAVLALAAELRGKCADSLLEGMRCQGDCAKKLSYSVTWR